MNSKKFSKQNSNNFLLDEKPLNFSDNKKKKSFLKTVAAVNILTMALANVSICSVYAADVIPSGEAVGVKLYSDGLLITSITEVTDEKGMTVNAAFNAGLRCGDRIIAVDGNKFDTSEQFSKYINERKQKIVFCIERKNKSFNKLITPVKTPNGYKIGVWVRDSTAGIGTITCLVPKNNTFFGLGHGISDIDTGEIMKIKSGKVVSCNMQSPTKGERGAPGELNGIFSNHELGSIKQNTKTGILGDISLVSTSKTLETANDEEIHEGDAQILCDVDGCGISQYDVEIVKLAPTNRDFKNMVLKVRDEKLINITGGIVQGMSGAPIIQDNKLIGAVTHVFINDPRQGYGIFISKMLSG